MSAAGEVDVVPVSVATDQTSAPERPSRSLFRRMRAFDPRYLVLGIASVVVAYLAIVPVGTMLYTSLRTSFLTNGSSSWSLEHYSDTLTSSSFWKLVESSFLYAVPTAALATTIGFLLAWITVRTNTPFKGVAKVAALVPLIIPGLLNTVSWAFLLSPSTGPLNSAFHAIGLPRFDVFSLAGMIFVQSTHVTPIAFLLGSAAFSSMDGSLEEAALASGASPLRVFWKITVRMVRPAIMSAALLIFIQTISSFEVPELIGVPGHRFVFVSRIYNALLLFPPDYGTVGVIGAFVLVVAILCLVGSQRLNKRSPTQTITGKGFRPTVRDLGRWRWLTLAFVVLFVLVDVLTPIAMLLYSALLPSYESPSWHVLHQMSFSNFRRIADVPELLESVENSLKIALISGVIATVLCSIVAYMTVKTRMRGRWILDGVATAPIAVPSVLMGIGILYFYLAAPLPVHLYGTTTIMVIAFVTISMPYGMRYISVGYAQIKDELEEAATASGASWFQVFRRIYVPLLVPSLLAAFLYTMIVAFREVSAAIFLYSQNTEVVSVNVFSLWGRGAWPECAALGVLMVAVLAVIAGVIRLVGGRFGLRSPM